MALLVGISAIVWCMPLMEGTPELMGGELKALGKFMAKLYDLDPASPEILPLHHFNLVF